MTPFRSPTHDGLLGSQQNLENVSKRLTNLVLLMNIFVCFLHSVSNPFSVSKTTPPGFELGKKGISPLRFGDIKKKREKLVIDHF